MTICVSLSFCINVSYRTNLIYSTVQNTRLISIAIPGRKKKEEEPLYSSGEASSDPDKDGESSLLKLSHRVKLLKIC